MGEEPKTNRFRSHYIDLAKSAIAKADSLEKQGHAGLRGLLREIFISNLLEKVLPPEVRVGSGQLTCVSGQLSPQIDVILYAPSIIPPAVYDGKNGYFPTECCLYTIEVKTTLTNPELKKAVASAQNVQSFSLLGTEHWTAFAPDGSWLCKKDSGTPYPVAALFAYSTDLSSGAESELKRYRAIDPNSDTKPAISVICIRGVGYWYFDPSGWKFAPETDCLDEVIYFLAGVANTIPHFMVAKGRPRFGRYLTGGPEIFDKCDFASG